MLRRSFSLPVCASSALIAGCATLLGLDEDRELREGAGGSGAGPEGGAPVAGATGAGGSSPAAFRALVARDGAIAHYTFDDPGTFEDSLGSSPTLVPMEGVEHVDGWLESCASFDGVDGTATAGDTFQFASTASMTIEVLVYPEDFPDDYQQLVGKRRVIMGPPKIEDGYSLSIAPSGQIVFARLNASASRNVSAAIQPNRFSHVVATFDNASGTSTLWINGQFGEANDTAGEIALISTSEPFRVAGATSINFFGKLDELAIYDRALEQSEVLEHFQALPPP